MQFTFLTGQQWQRLPPTLQREYIDRAVSYWRERGFPYPVYDSHEIEAQYRALTRTNPERLFLPGGELQWSGVGLGLANSYHPQMWSVKFARHRTPVECFNDDSLLRACLRRALTLWPRRRGASPATLRDILRTFRHTRRVSNFRPTVARALYARYSSSGDRVLDFSSGYGGRLLGCLTLRRHYVGCDPCLRQIRGQRRMYHDLSELGLPSGTAELRRECAEEMLGLEESESYGLVFTSPPYFDREKYSGEPTQSYRRYDTYPKWRNSFLRVVIEESFRILKPGGHLILNVADTDSASVADDTLRYASRRLELTATYRLRLSTLPYRNQRRTSPYHCEPVFVFRKS